PSKQPRPSISCLARGAKLPKTSRRPQNEKGCVHSCGDVTPLANSHLLFQGMTKSQQRWKARRGFTCQMFASHVVTFATAYSAASVTSQSHHPIRCDGCEGCKLPTQGRRVRPIRDVNLSRCPYRCRRLCGSGWSGCADGVSIGFSFRRDIPSNRALSSI